MMRVVRVIGAFVALVVLVVGWPVALWAALGNPWPAGGIDLSAPLTDDAIVFALAALLWLLWAQFAVCVLVEGFAALRGMRMPARIPGAFGVQQQLARRLVGALLTASVGAGVAATAGSAGAAVTTPAAATAAAGGPAAVIEQTADAQEAADEVVLPVYTTKGDDTLWGIARDQLGDPTRWREIAGLNHGHRMNDGRTFVDGDRIQPGWELRLPADADLRLAANTTTDVVEQHSDPASRTVRVSRGDTLSSLAAQHLGDADRWPELMRLNRDRPQTEGGRLSDPDRLRPGWVLQVPAPPDDGHRPPVHDAQPDKKARDKGEDAAEGERRIEPMRTQGSAESSIAPPRESGGEVERPDQADASPAVDGRSDRIDAGLSAADAEDESDGGSSIVWMAGGIAGVLAAGFVGFVGRRRMLQARRRRFGERIAMPDPDAAGVERELRSGEDPLTVEAVDVAMRQLAVGCADAGLALPKVQLVRICGDMIELYLAEVADLPGPFETTSDRGLWQIERSSLATGVRDDLRESAPAAYPSLVTVGVDEDGGHLLVNLEQLGAFGVVGESDVARNMLAAMTLELAVSDLADDLVVTVCGLDERFAALDTGRVMHRTAEEALAALEARARVARRELDEAGMSSATQARIEDEDELAWAPQILVVAGEVGEQWQRRLDAVVEAVPRVAVAAVTQTSTRSRWVAEVTADGDQVKAVLQPAGVRVTPQVVTDETYEQLVRLVETTAQPARRPDVVMSGMAAGGVATIDPDYRLDVEDRATVDDDGDDDETGGGDDGDEAAAGAVALEVEDPVPDDSDSGTEADDGGEASRDAAPPRVLVLGPVDVEGARGPILSSRRTKALEIAAYLALLPGRGVQAFWDAVWPDRSPASDKTSTKRNRVTEVRKWFGASEDGEEYLPVFRRGSAYGFGPAVRSDWDVWRELVGDDIAEASTEALAEALGLIRGRPFEGAKIGTYAWAQPLITEMLAQIVDAADELGRRHLAAERWTEAAQAAAVGVMCEPVAERLWRIQIRAAYASGNASNAREVISRMVTFHDNLGLDADDEETTMLLQLVRDHAPREQILRPFHGE